MHDEYSQHDKASHHHAAHTSTRDKLTSNWPDSGNITPKSLDMWFVDEDNNTIFQHRDMKVCIDFMLFYPNAVLRHCIMTAEQLQLEKEYHNVQKDLNMIFKK